MDNKSLAIYQTPSGAIELAVDATNETIWATQKQIAGVFDVNVPAINKHISNIVSEGELDDSTISIMEIVQEENGREVRRNVNHYSLDMIISVGYRVGSGKGTAFRKWATSTLRNYITDGYAINPVRIEHNRTQFVKALEDLKLLSSNAATIGSTETADLALAFASTWLSLDAYDTFELPKGGNNKKHVDIGSEQLQTALAKLKVQLVDGGEATELFGTEREIGGLDSLFHNVFQSFAGADVYPTLEEKAAHLLYFTVKDHVFIDGNKRSGAYAFVWFLQQVDLLNISEISPQALTALTLLVAESDPKDKDRLVGLVLLLLGVER